MILVVTVEIANIYNKSPIFIPEEDYAIRKASIHGIKGDYYTLYTQVMYGDKLTKIGIKDEFFIVKTNQIKSVVDKSYCIGLISKKDVTSEEGVYIPRLYFSPHDSISMIARKYSRSSYLWGGLSKKGLDCSGLIYLIHKYQGRNIPRFSQGQYEMCLTQGKTYELTFGNMDKLLPDSLIFVIHESRVIHVILVTDSDTLIDMNGSEFIYRFMEEDREDKCIQMLRKNNKNRKKRQYIVGELPF